MSTIDFKKFEGAKLYLAKINMPEYKGLFIVIAEGDMGARLRISDWCKKNNIPAPEHHTSMNKDGPAGECAITRMDPDEFGVCAVKLEHLVGESARGL